jgi:hypothetical protein
MSRVCGCGRWDGHAKLIAILVMQPVSWELDLFQGTTLEAQP